jgi:ATP-dependent helicase/DNAse subunit B
MVRLWIGGPGSGKTTRVLDELRRADGAARLVVPTATMAEHLRHKLAREGAHVRPTSVVTLAGWMTELMGETRIANSTDLTLLTAQALEELRPAEYAALIGSPGLAGALANAMEDLANAGCDSVQWTALASFGVHRMKAFETIYTAVERKLEHHGVVTRAAQLGVAARKVREQPVARVWFDGFFQFTPGELELVRALGEVGQVTVTLPEWQGAEISRDALKRSGAREERFAVRRPAPRLELLAATSREREVDEIALRLLEERAHGREWNEMGVIVRGARPYAPLVETTFARVGIPARAYFAPPLAGHAVGRFLARLIEALLSGWEGEKTIAALRSAVSVRPLSGAEEYELRDRLPFRGLDALGERVPAGLDQLNDWLKAPAAPAEWARRLAGLGRFVAMPTEGPHAPEAVRAYRLRAAALRTFAEAMEQTAAWIDAADLPLDAFWKQARESVHLASVRVEDGRRDVVHILDAHEARQWELPVVFVCGLVEGEFPKTPRGDAVLNEDTRVRLRESGVLVRTRVEREHEEAFLFELARTRASERLVLSWPEFDESGRPMARAFALDLLPGEPKQARRLTVRPTVEVPERVRPALGGDDVLDIVRDKFRRHRPTGIEVFLQCPYQFFARFTLEVEAPPALPAERLDALALGTLVHRIIADFHRGVDTMENLAERLWSETLAKLRVPPSHRQTVSWLQMKRSLLAYAADSHQRLGWQVDVERTLTLKTDRVEVRGRADRVDSSPEGDVVVYDFKYSGDSSVKKKLKKVEEGLLVQGGLYLAALAAEGHLPLGFYFAGVRGETAWAGSEDADDVERWMTLALNGAGDAAERVASGDIRVLPADTEACGYCDFADACRVAEEGRRAAEAGGTE